MSVLTTKGRKHLKPSTFGLPGKKAYPMPDKGHAAAKGKLSPEDAAKIRHKANAILGETDSTYHNQ